MGASAVVLLSVLSGCGGFDLARLNPWGGGQAERLRGDPADATVYACGDAKRLVVRYLAGTDSAMIVFRDREFRLDQAPASPGRFTNGSTTLHAGGEQVSLEEEGKATYTNCRKATL